MTEPLVLYYQLTLGPPHLARIRALNALVGVRCEGVQFASDERTRRALGRDPADAIVTTLSEGEYETLPRFEVLQAALRHLDQSGAAAIIVDAPADPVQFFLGRLAHRRGCIAATRWAATWTDHPRKRWKEFLKGFMYRGWDAYLATGERSIEYLKTFGVDDDSIFTCGNPVDSEAIASARHSLHREDRRENFLFVGRFLKLKNLERFARAWLQYRQNGGGWTLDLVGFGESEPELRRLLEGCADVSFHGHLGHEELLPLYFESGCLVLPSFSENWGLVVSEAMHAGMPITISTVTGCAPELLVEGENGYSMDPFDVGSMCDVLARMEALEPAERALMGARSLAIIADHDPTTWAEAVLAGLRQSGLAVP